MPLRQLSLTWTLGKYMYIVPIPVSRKDSPLRENAGAVEVNLTTEKIADINEKLGQMEIFSMFGGSPVKK